MVMVVGILSVMDTIRGCYGNSYNDYCFREKQMKTLLAILFFALVFYYLGKKEGAEEEKQRIKFRIGDIINVK